MRYEFVGKKVPYSGKTLWEIVGNLKNFGVGRFVKKAYHSNSELSFFKILKVQPIPPYKNKFKDRNVIVFIEEIYKGCQVGVKKTLSSNNLPMFHLISREDEYDFEKLKNCEPPVMSVMKYCTWPPLYKILWEKGNVGEKNYGPIPKLKRLRPDYPGCTIIEEEKEVKPSTCTLYKGEFSAEEMYKEIVRLKLLIKTNA